MKSTRATRRAVLAGAGGVLAGGSIVSQASMQETEVAAEAVTTVILQHRRLTLPADVQRRLAGNGARVIPLEEDPVRMWRGEHAPLLDRRDTRLLGVTPWAEFLMVRGLAAESGRRVRYQRVDKANDAIVWLIA